MPGENAVLNLLPRGEKQTLAVFQPKGAAAPKVTPPSAETGVVIENPENNYVVILDGSNRPVRDLTALRDGTYTVITSNYGRRTQSQTLKVGSDGLSKVSVPRLAAATPNPTAVRQVLPTAPGYVFLVFSASGALVTDASVLQPGYYDVFSYRNGEEGPLAGSQFLQVGQLTTLKFNGTFAGSIPQPATVQSPDACRGTVDGRPVLRERIHAEERHVRQRLSPPLLSFFQNLIAEGTGGAMCATLSLATLTLPARPHHRRRSGRLHP